jgi:acetoacetyl-CoA reductase/3-oxoacyl-[acyl-carrier protein] reductase
MNTSEKWEVMKKTAIVTGGSRGIGAAISKALAIDGISVALTYLENRDLADAVVEEITKQGGEALALSLRNENRQSIKTALETVRKHFGPVQILVNNAAIAQEKPFETISDEDWDNMMAVNLRGPFACCQEALPDMIKQKWGRIINITSIGGQWGGVNQVHYAVAKAGLIGFTRSLARVYSEAGVTTNAIAPGLVGTDMAQQELESEAGQKKIKGIPVGRIATLEEVATAAVFLSSEAASYITGQCINVNGGMFFST